MANQITGKIHAIGQTRQIAPKNGGNPFFRRELILDCSTYDRFNGNLRQNFVSLEFGGNRCSDLDQYRVGDMACVSFALQGMLYQDKQTGETKCFTHIEGYKIERVAVAQALPPQQAVQQQPMAANPPQTQYQQPQVQNMQPSYSQPAPTQLQTPPPMYPQQAAPVPQSGQSVYGQAQPKSKNDCPF